MTGAPPSPADQEVVQATVQEVIFRSPDGRFAVVRAERDRRDAPLTVVGDLGHVVPGETLRLRGRFTTHAVYGPRFQASAFTPVLPTSLEGVTRYLGSGLVPGIGPGLAQRLVNHFGDRTLDVIATESARLREVDGIGPRRAESIAASVRARRAEAETSSFLHGLGLGPATVRRLLRRYGDATVRVVREDPYLVAEQVRGIGFRTADGIGRAAGIAPDDPRRAAGAVLHLLARGADAGHVLLPREALRAGALDLDVPVERIDDAIAQLAARGLVVTEDEAVYAPPLHHAERTVAARIRALSAPLPPPKGVEEAIERASSASLSATQRRAVRASFSRGLMVLTGGPGTGKTTTVRAVVRAHELVGHRVVLCAPTGRAAKRMSEATGAEARTIHRALEWSPQTGSFKRDEHYPLEADVVLVDEASMLDLLLAERLLAAVPPSAALVLVGDVDQLPPVGPGPVLRDVIASGAAEVVRLTEIFRQAQRSAIVRGAHAILEGHVPTPTPAGTRGEGDLFVVRARDPDAIASLLKETLRRMSVAYGLDPRRDVQVLTPMRRGPLGTTRLNEILQEELNPAHTTTARPGALRPGDKVMQLRNDYDRDVFNGDLGEVRSVADGVTHIAFDGRDVEYGPDNLDAVSLAYASTIHKMQGSELPAVVVLLHSSHWVLLSRALLYTAVTRARRLVVLLGDERAMGRAVRNATSQHTHSRLLERIAAVDG